MYRRPTAPRTIGGVLDDAIRLYVAAWRGWLLPAALGASLSAAIGVWATLKFGQRPTSFQVITRAPSAPLLACYFFLVALSVWTSFAVLAPIVRVQNGWVPTPAGTLAAAVRLLPGAILGSILCGLGVAAGIGFGIIPGIWLAGRWLYWGVPMLAEQLTAPDAIGRSWHVSARNWWRGTAIVAVALVVMTVLSLVVGFIVGVVVVIGRVDPVMKSVITECIGAILDVVILPAGPAAVAAAYFDLRLRRDGEDLAARVDSLVAA